MITIDFETEAIVGNPLVHAPRPVGVALMIDGKAEYLPMGAETNEKLARIWAGSEPLLFHNAPFDLSVAEQHLGLAWPEWERVHDTQYLLFLKNPHARTLSLKPSAEHYLDLPPDEQNTLRDWILANTPAKLKDWGAYIAEAPFELVAPYAIGDVVRTRQLYDFLSAITPTEPYDRERRLAPILARATRNGVRVNRDALGQAVERYQAALEEADARARGILRAPELSFNSPLQLADALEKAELVDGFVMTAKGNRSTSMPALAQTLKSPELLTLLQYRSSIDTCLHTFLLPWYTMSEEDGRLHPGWNSVRGEGYGTRTGRLSSSAPNFQNVPNESHHETPEGLPAPPTLREYLLPEEGHVWLKRDFSSQEVRMLAHFEDGALQHGYKEDPRLDPHSYAQKMMKRATGIEYPRKAVKITAFTVVYGGSGRKIADTLRVPEHEGYAIKEAYLQAFPGVRLLQRELSRMGQPGNPIVTWGGREYETEPAKYVNGRYQRYEYKLLNYLIQGSAADQTKECINQWEAVRGEDVHLLATVHDEINISAPAEDAEVEMEKLRIVMDSDSAFDVPMRSEGFTGANWAECK